MKRLTPAQREILLLTAEEAAELAAECMRQLRAGKLDRVGLAKACVDVQLNERVIWQEAMVDLKSWRMCSAQRFMYLNKMLKHIKVMP